MREHPLTTRLRFILLFVLTVFIAAYSQEIGMVLATGFGWWPGCGCCETPITGCTACTGNASSQMQAVISGVTNPSVGCASCSTLDGTYVLDNIAGATGPWDSHFGVCAAPPDAIACCIWQYSDDSSAPCPEFYDATGVCVEFGLKHPGLFDQRYLVAINKISSACTNSGRVLNYLNSFLDGSDDRDCEAFSSYSITPLNIGGDCDEGNSSSCLITSL